MRFLRPALLGSGLLLAALLALYWIVEKEALIGLFPASPGDASRGELLQMRDSLEQLDFLVRNADSTEAAKLQKDQANLWQRYQDLRDRVVAHAESGTGSGWQDLWRKLRLPSPWILIVVAGVTLLLFVAVVQAFKRKSAKRSLSGKTAPVRNPVAQTSQALADAVRKIESIRARAEKQKSEDFEMEIPNREPRSSRPVFHEEDAEEENETREFSFEVPDKEEPDEEIVIEVPPTPKKPPVRSPHDLFMEDADDQMAPAPEKPSEAKADFEIEEQRRNDVLKQARRGYTASEISRRLRISQDQVEVIIRLHREKGA